MRISYDAAADAAYIQVVDVIGPGEVDKTYLCDPDEVGGMVDFCASTARSSKGLRSATGARVEAFLGWSPASPQDSLILDQSLGSLLAAYEAEIVIDTYSG